MIRSNSTNLHTTRKVKFSQLLGVLWQTKLLLILTKYPKDQICKLQQQTNKIQNKTKEEQNGI
jgi:hypothetical protein